MVRETARASKRKERRMPARDTAAISACMGVDPDPRAFGLAACADKKEAQKIGKKTGYRAGNGGAGVYVDKAWSFAREVSGHRIHVLEQRSRASVVTLRPPISWAE